MAVTDGMQTQSLDTAGGPVHVEPSLTIAASPPRLPRWLRIALMGALFLLFFCGAPVITFVIFPLLWLTSKSPEDHRRRCTRLLHHGERQFARAARFVGLVDFVISAPPSVDLARPYVMISNHPSYVDMILVLGAFENLTCMTKGSWSRHWALGPLLRATNYLPGPGSGLRQSEQMLDSMVAHLRAGHPLLIFPEGQRSMKDQLRRFRRGAVEAAVRANVPIVPLYLAMDRPYLTKSVPIWRAPDRAPKYTFEWFDVIHPEEFGHDGKRIQDHVDAMYAARFERQRVAYRELAETSGD